LQKKARPGFWIKIASVQFLSMSFPLENSQISMQRNDAPSLALLVLQSRKAIFSTKFQALPRKALSRKNCRKKKIIYYLLLPFIHKNCKIKELYSKGVLI